MTVFSTLVHVPLEPSEHSLSVQKSVTQSLFSAPRSSFFAIYGFVNTGIDIKEEYFLPTSSSEKSFIEQYREQFGKTTQFMELTIENSIEYHDHEVQNNIFDIMDFAIEEGYATRAINWLSEFAKFEKASIYDVNPDTFVPVVNLVFLPSETYRKYASDIIMDRFQTQIVKSRMYLE
uniref:Uncharacterized protein n=1 Tax=Caenorhabditis japonica TaxID=281687 RepID=A0A8R1ETM0_CAEJA